MTRTLYVGNIPWSTREDALKQFFLQFGEVVECRIITETATGRSRGYGFIEVSEESMEDILKKSDGADLDGRKLVVNEAKPRDQ